MRIPFIMLLAAAMVLPALAEHAIGPSETKVEPPPVSEGPSQRPFPPFEQLDRDGNGRLDAREVAGVEPLNRQFGAADVDQSGSLSESEFSAFEIIEGVMPAPEGIHE